MNNGELKRKQGDFHMNYAHFQSNYVKYVWIEVISTRIGENSKGTKGNLREIGGTFQEFEEISTNGGNGQKKREQI